MRLRRTIAVSGLVRCVCLLSLIQVHGLAMQAQASASKSGAASASDFSIETEMLTYRALQSNSEAVACDVAAYLYGTAAAFKKTATGSSCSLNVPGGAQEIGVILLPFGSTAVSEFNVWRSDMQAMADLQRLYPCRVAQTGDEWKKPTPTTDAAPNKRSVATPLLATPTISAGTAAASGILALLASQREVSSVVGTVQDQALMDSVSRELLHDHISVVSPSAYTPYGFTALNPSQSPYLQSLQRLEDLRECRVALKIKDDRGPDQMDKFLATLGIQEAATKGAAAMGSTAAASTTAESSTAPSHLQAVLAADGLARRLHADPVTGEIPETAAQHLLLVKALESGGTVSRLTYVLGTRISYSGGAVDTYALFNLQGQLECSGNVYDYAGSLSAKGFRKKLNGQTLFPAEQVIFQDGSCHR